MKKNLFRIILKKLLSCFGTHLQGNAFKRVKKLAGLICGLLRKKKPDMGSLGYGIDSNINAHSREKAAADFLYNKWIDYDSFYLPFLKELLSAICYCPDFKIVLVIDGSKMGSQHMALMVSLYYKGRGIPLVWLVHKKKKGHFDSATHIQLLEATQQLLSSYLPADRPILLLGDGEFSNTNLQKWCQHTNWTYAARIAKDAYLYEQGLDEECFQPKNLQVVGDQDFLFIPNVEYTKEARLAKVNFVLWHDPKHEDPLPLISNLKEAIDIIEAYDLRYSIECLFKDMKSNTFNLHKTRLRNAYAISNLVMVGAFALTLLLKVGLKYEDHEIREKIHRLRPDRTVNTLITYGLKLIEYLLDHLIAFSFQFDWSTKLKTSP